ncbi:MAG: radical SAM protein [Bacilli bacterium]|nr:radical SAM protein [Bacilli bacterium]
MSEYFDCIPPFDDGAFHFLGAWVAAQNEKYSLLLGGKGSSIALSAALCEGLRARAVSYGLGIKLMQHGLATIDGIEPLEFCHRPKPRYFIIDLTNSCNFDCIYCFRDGGHCKQNANGRLRAILEYIRRYCEKNGVYHIGIQAWGGEPLLEADKVIEIAEYFADGAISASVEVETNAALIDDRLAERLRTHGIHLGVSIDGPRRIHERQRRARSGESSYDLTLRGIEAIKRRYGDSFGSISVVTKYSVRFPEEMVKHLVEIGVKYAKFNVVRDNRYAREDGLVPEICDVESFYMRLFEVVCQRWKNGAEFFESTIQTRLENLVLSSRKNCCESCGCTGGRAIFSFDRSGGIFPCEMTDFSEECIGQIDDGGLDELLEKSRKSVFLIERKATICRDCPWWCFCRGGCTSRVHYRGENGIDEIACAINRVLYPLIAKLIVDEPALAEKMLRHSW